MNETTKKVLSLIQEKGLSNRQFEISCNLPNGSVNGWAKNRFSPSVKALEKIADYFDLPISYFYEEKAKKMNLTTIQRIIDKINSLVETSKLSVRQFELQVGLSISSINAWRNGKANPSAKALEKIANYFNLPISYFYEEHYDSDRTKFPTADILRLPVLYTVSAGFNHEIIENDDCEIQEIPSSIIGGYKENELFVFSVSGDSMFPKFLDGDRVLVARTPSVSSGDIAVVTYDDYQDGTLKKVVYEPNCDFFDLIPLNAKYAPVRIQGESLTSARIIGKVIYLFRKI